MLKKIRKILVDICKKNITIRKLARFIKISSESHIYRKYYQKYQVNDKTILFETFGGRNYGCSPKAIYEQMLKMPEFNDYKFIWAFKKPEMHKVKPSKNLHVIKTKSEDYYKYLSIAKYWIVNSIIGEEIKKKDNQVYIQCWHGTPLKRLRYDREVNGSSLNTVAEIRKRNDIDASRFDYFISPSAYCTKVFTSAFNLEALGKKDIIIEEGYPRNDSLFNRKEEEIKNIKKELGIPLDKKVIFYLPTFRDNQHTSGVGYTYKVAVDFKRLQEKFSKDYIILFSPHYFVANELDLSEFKGFVYNVAHYDDINDLYLVSDIIMTDYSSVFFDFANLKKPMLFYMYDLDDYKNNLRDFYISLDELPGPIAKTQDELEYNILNIDKISRKYFKKYQKFNKKFNYLDDGNSSTRVIKKIFKE